jgi:hypothetical protein
MTATVTHYQASVAVDMERALALYVGHDPWPPVAGIKYAACGVYAEYQSSRRSLSCIRARSTPA